MDKSKGVRERLKAVADWLAGLGFRTGLAVLCACVVFYILSFAQMALPIPVAWKGALWAVLFGLAKASQYTALLILGKEGVRRVRQCFSARRIP
ncbi:MAG: hypothetical protein HDR80_06260 [Bacteroides sp.]|nr:hypothetical protein [Bacteroides sp.]